MSDLDDLFDQLPIGQIAKELGVDKTQASSAVAAALPTLVKGLQANAQDPAAALSLFSALQGKDASLVSGAISLADVDTKDGAKIVSHIFGGNGDEVASRLGGVGGSNGLGSDLSKKLLTILAPIVLAWLVKKVTGGGSSSSKADGGIGDILGQVLGGGGSSSSGGGLLEGVLGQVLGGGSSKSSGGLGGLDDLLGGLLGGGSR